MLDNWLMQPESRVVSLVHGREGDGTQVNYNENHNQSREADLSDDLLSNEFLPQSWWSFECLASPTAKVVSSFYAIIFPMNRLQPK